MRTFSASYSNERRIFLDGSQQHVRDFRQCNYASFIVLCSMIVSLDEFVIQNESFIEKRRRN